MKVKKAAKGRPSSIEMQKQIEVLCVEQGYAVIGFPPNVPPFRTGETTASFAGFILQGKYLQVVGRAKFSDWKKQCAWLNKRNPAWQMTAATSVVGAHYCKVQLKAEGE